MPSAPEPPPPPPPGASGPPTRAVQVVVRGRVQGVGFRASCAMRAGACATRHSGVVAMTPRDGFVIR